MWLNNQIAPYVLKLNLDLNNQFGNIDEVDKKALCLQVNNN